MAKKQKQQHPKTVATLEKSDCRWPIGDPREADFHFCGAHQAPGRPYCELHWRMAFQPSRPRHVQSAPALANLRAA
jgi:GcrA cell cycle regulator